MGKEIVKKGDENALAFSPETLISQAIDKGVGIETMEKLLAMRKELKHEWSQQRFNKAMAAFQGECPVIGKGKTVKNKDSSVRYRYAPLDAIVRQVSKFISKNGLSYTINAEIKDQAVIATVIVTHEDGYSQASSFVAPLDADSFMNVAQKYGAALTYAKRYAFCNAFGILTGDDDTDGVAAEGPSKGFVALKKLVAKMSAAELDDYVEKMKTSDKYTQEQKVEFGKLVEARRSELRLIESRK